MTDYALIVGMVAICVISALSHVGELHNNTFSLLSHTFEEALRAYDEEVLNLQNAQTIAEYASVANGTADAIIAQSWAASTVYGEDNIIAPEDSVGSSNPGTQVDPEGNINHPPIARFGFYNDIRPGLGTWFKLLNTSYDEDGDRIAKAEWSGVPTSNKFESAGVYTIKLRVADEHGLWSDWYAETFEIENQNPVAVITKDLEFQTLSEEDEDLAVNSDKYCLIGTAHQTLKLYDKSSYDPDGHPLKTSYWNISYSGMSTDYTLPFEQGLEITQTKSGPVSVILEVEDLYNGKSNPDTMSFYYFASNRPEIRNISFSDGSNGSYSVSSLSSTDWVTEVYPYTTENELQIPVSTTDTRISFQVEDDSDVITTYQYKLNGIESDLINLNLVSKDGENYFYLADLTDDFVGKNGSATMNFRVCDDSDTCSRWTEDIRVVFKSVSEVQPLIKTFTIQNYSTYDTIAISNDDSNNYFIGSFLGTIEIDDIYGGMRTINDLDLFWNNAPLSYSNLQKVTNTKYTFEFSIDNEYTDATIGVRGIYDTGDQTDEASIEDINVFEYSIEIKTAELYNANFPEWYNINLLEEGTVEQNKISSIADEYGTDGFYYIKVNYESVFNAPITAGNLYIYNPDGNIIDDIAFDEYKIQQESNQTVILKITDAESVYMDSSNFNDIIDDYEYVRIALEISDEMYNTSEDTSGGDPEHATIISYVDFHTYTPEIISYTIKDIDNKIGTDSETYSRGLLNVEYKIKDYFLPIKDNIPTINVELLDSDSNDITGLNVTDLSSTRSSAQEVTTTFKIDTNNWSIWEETLNPMFMIDYDYGTTDDFPPSIINLNNYTPNSVNTIAYESVKSNGKYTIGVGWSNSKDYFNIDHITLNITTNGASTTRVINSDNFTINSNNIIFYSDKLPSRSTSKVEVTLSHTNNVADSNSYFTYITVEKPYDIPIEEVEHREPSMTTDGFTKIFPTRTRVDTTDSTDLFENIDLRENDANLLSTIAMKTTDGSTQYATYNKIAITPTGSIIFSNNSVGSASASNFMINSIGSGNITESVYDDSYSPDMFTIFTGDIIYDNSPGSGSGIYYRHNIHYLDVIEQSRAKSTTIKYINICSASDWDYTMNTCSHPFSIEATVYDNGSVIVHYGNIPENVLNDSIIAAKINEEPNNTFWTTAYGEYNGNFANKTLTFNTLPNYYLIPPTITNVIYEQSDSTTKPTIDATTSETILAKYTVEFYNPDNVSVIVHDGSLTQYQLNPSTGELEVSSSAHIVADGSAVISNTRYVFESANVIRRATDKATIKLRLKYSESPDYYTAFFEKNDYSYVGPVIISFTASVPTHIEPTKDITGYTPLDFTTGKKGSSCPAWSENTSNYFDDCSSALLPLGFEMAYINGERVDSISVSTNSLIRFNSIVQTGYTAQPVTGLEDDTLAVLWYDQDFQGISTNAANPKGIFYKRFLDAEIPYISLKYMQLSIYSSGSQPFDYEVQIYQDGKVIVHYSKEVPVLLEEVSAGNYASATTVAFKKTMLIGYGSLVVPETESELNELMDFISTRKFIGSDVTDDDSYIGMSSTGKSIQINLGQCNALNESCSTYVPPQTVENETVYSCTGATETVNLPAGTYKLQAWGAQGGNTNTSGGKGAYAEETIKLSTTTQIYVNVGCAGSDSNSGFNGGGINYLNNNTYAASGGGASDIRISDNQIAHRILVAAGGGGAGKDNVGGAGGTVTGLTGSGTNAGLGGSINNIFKADMSTVAFSGYLGYGGSQTSLNTNTTGGAGGGGYFGGNAGNSLSAGGGGSSYTYNNSTYVSNPSMIAGNAEMPTPDHSGTKIGQNGNGKIIITKIADDNNISAFNTSVFVSESSDLLTSFPNYSNFNIGDKTVYTDNSTSIQLDPGTYRLQTWGANGGAKSTSNYGRGGYSEGVLAVESATQAYIYVGGSGSYSSTTSTLSPGGFNGGGSGSSAGGSGGGASDIRLFQDSLSNRVIVAGGGGGGNSTNKGGAGGGDTGVNGAGTKFGTGGTQTSAGSTTSTPSSLVITPADFGIGASFTDTASSTGSGSGGGGGYYGGGVGIENASGGGGSGFVHEKLTYANTYNGATSFKSPTDATETGHNTSGKVIITKLTNETYNPITEDEFASFKIGDVRNYTTTTTDTIDPGTYKLELWGSEYNGLKGDYSQGIITFNTETELSLTLPTLNQNTTANIKKSSTNILTASHSDSLTNALAYTTVASSTTSGQIIAGLYSMPSSADINTYSTGNSGNAHARITRLQSYEIIPVGSVQTYQYDNSTNSITLPIGTYTFETWGAQGGDANSNSIAGGLGGYAKGTISVNTPTQFYLTVGGKGENSSASKYAVGGFNGGGNGSLKAGAGGGASDIRRNNVALSSRIIVAGGGGGSGYVSASNRGTGGAGGGTTGSKGTHASTGSIVYYGFGGTQSMGGQLPTVTSSKNENGSLGIGGSAQALNSSNATDIVAGGGAGLYGGSSSVGYGGGAGGGSSYVHSSLTSTQNLSGEQSQPSPTSNGTQDGNENNGYIRITRLN